MLNLPTVLRGYPRLLELLKDDERGARELEELLRDHCSATEALAVRRILSGLQGPLESFATNLVATGRARAPKAPAAFAAVLEEIGSASWTRGGRGS